MAVSLAACGAPGSAGQDEDKLPRSQGGVTVYFDDTFDGPDTQWRGANGGKVQRSPEGADGGYLEVDCPKAYAGVSRSLDVTGPEGLKLACKMRARNLSSVGINIFDKTAGDNTTPYGPRLLADGEWTPVLYHLSTFRYNARPDGFVRADAQYGELWFYGPQKPVPDAGFAIDNFVVYRGADIEPPGKPEGLTAEWTDDGVTLRWKSAPDNIGAMVYVLARASAGGAFQKVAETAAPAWLDLEPAAGKRRYRVMAVDFEENLGPWSEEVAVEVKGPKRGVADAPVPPEVTDRARYAAHLRDVHKRGIGKVRRGHVALFGDSLTGATSYRWAVESALLTCTVSAQGHAGQRTSFGSAHVRELLDKQNPEFVFILFGTNNPKGREDIARAMADLTNIVKACEENGSAAILGTIPPRGFKDAKSGPEAAFNAAVTDLCRELEIPIAYIFEEIQASGDRKRFISGDGVHWTSAGMQAAARAWGRTMLQVRFALRDRDRDAGK